MNTFQVELTLIAQYWCICFLWDTYSVPWKTFWSSSIWWAENLSLERSHMHTEEQLSHWLLITMTSRHSSGRDCCQDDFVQVNVVQWGMSAAEQSEEQCRLRPREILPFEVVFHSKIMERVFSDIPFTHSLMCSFIYGSGKATNREFTSAFLLRNPVTSTYF